MKYTSELNKIDKTFIKKGKLKQQGNDYLFWMSQPYWLRIATIEQIRKEYNSWKYDTESGFQRVYSIIKRK